MTPLLTSVGLEGEEQLVAEEGGILEEPGSIMLLNTLRILHFYSCFPITTGRISPSIHLLLYSSP
jgi:hypothetical protein